MKKYIIIGLIVLVGGALLIMPFLKEEAFEGPYAKFNFEQDDLAMRTGEVVNLKIDILYDGITTLEVLFDDKSVKSWKSPKGTVTYSLKGTDELLGAHRITVRAVSADGETSDYRGLRILSDIIPERAKAEIVASFDHDPTSYTQGLEFYKGKLYEGTGDPGQQAQTQVGEIDLSTGKHIEGRRIRLDASYFGEGITILNDKVYQLTWKNGKCFVYDINDFMGHVDEFAYSGEGWGLCNDGKSLIMSDGSERITFRDPKTFATQRVIEVYDDTRPITQLNELEYINGLIYANIYQQNFIVVIDPKTGKVVQQIDVNEIVKQGRGTGDVLNGIAYNPETKKMIITGKYWTKYFEVKVTPMR